MSPISRLRLILVPLNSDSKQIYTSDSAVLPAVIIRINRYGLTNYRAQMRRKGSSWPADALTAPVLFVSQFSRSLLLLLMMMMMVMMTKTTNN